MATTAANRPSLARSLVGLVARPDGTASRRPPAIPAMILVTPSGLLQVFGALGVKQRRDGGSQGRLAGQCGVSADEFLRLVPGLADQLLVPQQREQLEARPPTCLRGTEDVSLPALLKIEPGQREAILGRCHGVEPLPRWAGCRLGDQQAQPWMAASADPAAQLM